jgi:hypothetical protein
MYTHASTYNTQMENRPDNIADVQTVDDDHYMRCFKGVEERCTRMRGMVAAIAHQPDQDQRLFAAIRCIEEQQRFNDDLYDLLVEMNNTFGNQA